MYVCTWAPTEARRRDVSLSRWNCSLLCDIWRGCWEPNFQSFPRAANALNHWALSQPQLSPLFIIKRKTDTFFTFFVSFTENGIFLTNADSVGHGYSSHDNGYVALKTNIDYVLHKIDRARATHPHTALPHRMSICAISPQGSYNTQSNNTCNSTSNPGSQGQVHAEYTTWLLLRHGTPETYLYPLSALDFNVIHFLEGN